jgi:hypothetical protein
MSDANQNSGDRFGFERRARILIPSLSLVGAKMESTEFLGVWNCFDY